ncbi:VanW family protein [Paenibacillus alvei TS-15]|uniref:VanW family protein n=1 Tax=Paenibacillus alvei TS-15 TaxID=1117108 RepID=S9ST96_PAEAL|nr:VanW family protein [Paenibacillus alvei]EPY07934.1 VanW family protein [Paenibacillus alvei TS-15]
MKKIHALFITVASLLLVGTAVWGLAHSYASQPTIPPNVHLSTWNIGSQSMDAFREQLKAKIGQLEQTPFEFSFADTNVEPVKTTLADLGVTYDAEPILRALDKMKEGSLWERIQARYYFPTSWTLQFRWNKDVWAKRLTPDWEEKTFGNPVNAQREITKDDTIRYTPEKTVLRIDRLQLEQFIRTSIPNTWIEGQSIALQVPLQKTAPPVTIASLKAEGIERKIIEFSTSFVQASDGRTHNVNAAAQTIHDMVLKPGEIFDYDKVIAETEKKYGFKEAPVIFNGKLVPGIGGGICQVSSTLYNAVLRTGLEIVERRNHSLPVSYLPIGLDATFSQGYINFRFKNTTGKHLIIRTAAEDDRLIIKFFGTMDKDVSYRMETKTLKVLEPTIKYVKNPNLPIGSHETIQKGKQGYTVESYRIKLVNGKVVERKKMFVDTYRPQPTLIAVNTGGSDQSSSKKDQNPILEDGVNGPVFNDES